MKNSIFTLFFFFIVSLNSKSQTLEILDAIAGSLLPVVVNGIKEIKNSDSNKKDEIKIKKEDIENQSKIISDYMNGIATALSNDASNLASLEKYTVTSARIYDDLGAIESLSTNRLVNSIIESNNDNTQRIYVLTFDLEFLELKNNIGGLTSEISSTIRDQNLKDLLTDQADQIGENFRLFENHLIQTGGGRISQISPNTQVILYLNAIKDSKSYIESIKSSVQRLLNTQSSRLNTYSREAIEVKAKIASRLKELEN